AGRGPAAGSMVQDQVGDDARGDGHQQHVAPVVAHPVVPVRRAAQLVTRVIVDHVDRAAVVVAVALSARPGMGRRARTVVHDLHVGLGAAGVAVAALVPGAVVGAVVPAMMLAAGAVVAPALMPAVVPAVPTVA